MLRVSERLKSPEDMKSWQVILCILLSPVGAVMIGCEAMAYYFFSVEPSWVTSERRRGEAKGGV